MQEVVCGQVWFVKGEEFYTPYATKADAEQAARYEFPDESHTKQHARIYYRDVIQFH